MSELSVLCSSLTNWILSSSEFGINIDKLLTSMIA